MSARASKSQVASAVSTYYLCQQLGMMGGAFLGAAVKGGVLGGMLWGKLEGEYDHEWLERVSLDNMVVKGKMLTMISVGD